MRPRVPVIGVAATLFAVVTLSAVGQLLSSGSQVATGSYQFGAFDSKGFDTINIGNLNAHFEIPLFSKAGRGGLNFSHSLIYNSSIWRPVTVSGSKTWQPTTLWGWQSDTETFTGDLAYSSRNLICSKGIPPTFISAILTYTFTELDGAKHGFFASPPISNQTCPNFPTERHGSFQATDNSGLILNVISSNEYNVLYPNGKVVVPTQNQAGTSLSVTDTNGNQLTSNATTYTDTTGTAVLTLTGGGTSSSPRVLTYPTYVGGSASTGSTTIYYTAYTVQTAFGCSGISEYSASSVNLVDHVVLADSQTYYFTYEATPGVSGSVTGRLASVKLPGGGRIDYAYSGGSNGIECQDGGTATLTRTMPDDPAGSTWTYTRTPGASGAANSHTEVVDGLSNYAEYDFVNDPSDTYVTPYVVSRLQYNGAASGTSPLAVSTCYNGATTCIGESLTLPIASLTATTTLDGSSVKQTTQTFNSNGLLTAQTDSDYGSGSPGSQVDAKTITYAALGNGIIGLPDTVSVFGSQSAPIQTTTYSYDSGTLVTTSGLPQHVAISGSRGNLTSVSVASGPLSSITVQTNSYDDAGQLQTSQDSLSHQTTYGYDSTTDTFTTSVTGPVTGGVAHTLGATYDTASGLMLTSTDLNGNSTSYSYDNMLRPTAVSLPASGAQSYTYSLASASPYTTSSVLHTGSSYITTTNYLDRYGRLSQADKTDTPHDDLVSYAYDADGRMYRVSNPYRTGDTPVYTQASFDGLGRIVSVLDSDGVGQSTYSYSGNATILTDEASKQRKVFVDAAGRALEVLEPDAGNSLTLETDYQYDQNQTTGVTPETYQTIVTQKGGSGSSSDWRVRTFTSDMSGNIVSETTPEAGTTTYTYPSTGGTCAGSLSLPCTRTDANGTITTYSYDALNRLTGKTYSGTTIGTNTPAIAYSYDQTSYNGLTIANSNGLRSGMSDGSGETAWSFDAAGRIAAIRKTLNSVTKQANYTYNADGTVNTLVNFGGTTFTYAYNVAGLPTALSDGGGASYASSALYSAAGQLTSVNHQYLPGEPTYVRSWQYNTRMQPSVISATLNGSTIQSLQYGYGGSGTNNGNILSILNGMDATRNQAFSYDNLNRLASGHDGSHWGESYTYDNWGNLEQTTRMSGYTYGNNWTVTASVENQLSNLHYDTAGEVTQDQLGNNYGYDAEGRLLSAGGGSYVYDGDGNRVKKTASSVTTLYWPGVDSLLDESDSTGSTMAKQVRFDGLLVWSGSVASGGRFLFQDQLGSTRITGTYTGTLMDDLDYLPFGSVEGNYGSAPSDNHYTFTGYESDQSESSTDYAVYRNLETTFGRFNRPDPDDESYDPTDPQSFNRYAYVLDDPLLYDDPLGLFRRRYPQIPVPMDPCNNLPGGCTPTTSSPQNPSKGGSGTGGRGGGGTGNAPKKDPCANATLTAARVDARQQIATAQSYILNSAGPFGDLVAYKAAVQTGGPNDIKDLPGHSRQNPTDVAAGNISFGITCPFGAGFCQFAAGLAQTLRGSPNFHGTLKTGFDTPSDNAQIRIGQTMRAAGCHE